MKTSNRAGKNASKTASVTQAKNPQKAPVQGSGAGEQKPEFDSKKLFDGVAWKPSQLREFFEKNRAHKEEPATNCGKFKSPALGPFQINLMGLAASAWLHVDLLRFIFKTMKYEDVLIRATRRAVQKGDRQNIIMIGEIMDSKLSLLKEITQRPVVVGGADKTLFNFACEGLAGQRRMGAAELLSYVCNQLFSAVELLNWAISDALRDRYLLSAVHWSQLLVVAATVVAEERKIPASIVSSLHDQANALAAKWYSTFAENEIEPEP